MCFPIKVFEQRQGGLGSYSLLSLLTKGCGLCEEGVLEGGGSRRKTLALAMVTN